MKLVKYMDNMKIGNKVYHNAERLFWILEKFDDVDKDYAYVAFINRRGREEESKKVLKSPK